MKKNNLSIIRANIVDRNVVIIVTPTISLAFDEPFVKTSNPNFAYQKSQSDRHIYKRIKDGKKRRVYYYYAKNSQEA